ncbi:hypothetical protein [Paraburkholderia sp. J7]|uniref:hypothetical protein n=1 Tax=Paraburkholderia sp. J7 TaxID=2805438 RepID=UPI002AB62292|nr:hypothetical protein [Paraburkholderia sp. J7]
MLERQIEGPAAAGQYALLKAWPNRSPAPRYLWQAAKVAAGDGQPAEALEYLSQLEAHERKSFDPSRDLLFQIELARCAVALEANERDSMSGFDPLVRDASLEGENRVAAILAALEAACRVAPECVSELGGRYLEAGEARGYGLSFATYDLSNFSMPVEGTRWDMSATTWPCGDVRPHLAMLGIASSGRAGIFFRA